MADSPRTLEYDWHGQRTKKRGWVGEEEFKVYLEKGRPESWSGGVFGRHIVHVTPAQMRAIIEGHVAKEDGKEYYTQVEWEVSYYECAKNFVDNTIPKLQALSEDGIGEDVRIVFFFDN